MQLLSKPTRVFRHVRTKSFVPISRKWSIVLAVATSSSSSPSTRDVCWRLCFALSFTRKSASAGASPRGLLCKTLGCVRDVNAVGTSSIIKQKMVPLDEFKVPKTAVVNKRIPCRSVTFKARHVNPESAKLGACHHVCMCGRASCAHDRSCSGNGQQRQQ